MALSDNRSNLRNKLKIDPNGKVWDNSTLNRFLNEGQRELVNDPDAYWPFQQTIGYLVPAEQGLNDFLSTDDDNPENFLSPKVKQFLRFETSGRGTIDRLTIPKFINSQATDFSQYDEYMDILYSNAGFENAATYTTLHNMDTFDGNGTWVAVSGETTNVATDATTYKAGSGSVSFDIDVSVTTNNYAEIANSTMTGVDISSYDLDKSAIILWVYLPEATYFNEVSVYFGSDSSNYYKVRNYKIDAQGKLYTAAGWNRIIIPTIVKNTTGSPDTSSIDYLKVRIGYDAAQTDQTSIRIDNIQIVDKYIRYFYLRKADDMSADTSISVVPSQYQFVYELYAEYKAWSILSGREEKAASAFSEYQRAKNRMKRELLWDDASFFKMRMPAKNYYLR